MSDDPFAGISADKPEVRTPAKKKSKFQSAAPEISRAQTQKATGDSAGMHGFYKQANFRLKPETLDEIDQWAKELRCNKSQLKRYLAWRGLQALRDGERPEYADGALELADY